MITFKDIYDFARNERDSKELRKLPEKFVEDVSDYLREKKEVASKQDVDFSDVITKTKKQLENALTLFRELIIRRRKKILDLVLIASETGISKKEFDSMLVFEKELFDELMKCVSESEKKIGNALNGKGNIDGDALVFKEDVGEFVDLNGEKIGGFLKGQTAIVPKEIAKILVDDGKAEVIKKS